MPADLNRPLPRPHTGPPSWPWAMSLALVLVTAPSAGAQPPPPPHSDDDSYYGDFNSADFNPSLAVTIAIIVAAFFFFGFFSIYLRRRSGAATVATAPRPAPRGLDSAALAAIPTLSYSHVKELNVGKDALECAVCLCEFEDKEFLRMLPKCCHVFHLDCIDTWLESHVTCPVCRSDLASASASAAADKECGDSEHLSIDVAAAEETAELARIASRKRSHRLGRSYTTGHSVWARPRERGFDRCTLRLPEHVRRGVVSGKGLRRAASCAGSLPQEECARSGYRARLGWVTPRFLQTLSARESPGAGNNLLDWLVGGGRASSVVNVDGDKSSAV